MANTKISQLNTYTGLTSSGYFVFNNSGETETFKSKVSNVFYQAPTKYGVVAEGTSAAIDVLLKPKIDGSYVGGAIVADTAGNTRGVYSIDVQFERANNTQVASGPFSMVHGRRNTANTWDAYALGYGNTVSGSDAFGLGESNTVSGSWSFAGGRTNTNNSAYSFVWGNNNNTNAKTNVAMLGTSGRTADIAYCTYVENLKIFNYSNLNFANDSDAAAGGVVLGQLYHTSGVVKVRIS